MKLNDHSPSRAQRLLIIWAMGLLALSFMACNTEAITNLIATPTFTPTSTSTSTSTPTNTSTPTSTSTPTNTPTATSTATPTPIPPAKATATAEIQAVQTIIAEAAARSTQTAVESTAIVRAEATMTAEAIAVMSTAASQAVVALEDDFTSNANGWGVGDYVAAYADGSTQIVEGVLHRSITSKRNVAWRVSPSQFLVKDFWLEVEATLVETSAGPGEAGIAFTFREDQNDNYYNIEFSNDGAYQIALFKDGAWQIIQSWQYDDLIEITPGQPTHFAILAQGNNFTFYVNDQHLTTITNDVLSGAGEIGLSMGLYQAGDTLTVDFDNLLIKEIPAPGIFADYIEATATARINSVATAQIKATATAVAQATEIAEAVVSFNEDFSSNLNGWGVGETNDDYGQQTDELVDGVYRRSLDVEQDMVSYQAVPKFSAQDFWLSFETTLVETSAELGDAAVGLAFREDKNGNYYVLEFANDNSYRLVKWQDNAWAVVTDWATHSAIDLTPGVSNTFTLLAKGSDFSLTVNDQFVATFTDDSLPGLGKMSLVATLYEGNQTLTVDFDNLIVKELPNSQKSQAQIEVTATARAEAVELVAIAPTATAIAQATAIASAPVVFEDDFSSNAHDWDVGEEESDYDTGVDEVVDGKYRRSIVSKDDVVSRNSIPDLSLKNFTLSVEATLVETSADSGDATVELTFREDSKGNYYDLEFANDGTYRVSLLQDDDWETIYDWESSEAIKLEPGVTNTFTIIVNNSDFIIYANDEYLTTISDDTLTEAGEISLAIGMYGADKNLTVDFDNLVVKELP